MTLLLGHPLAAQRTGLLVVAHGADSGWNARVRQVVEAVRWDGPVELAFLMGAEAESASWNGAVTRLDAAGIDSLVVVPLMVSSHGAHTRQIRYYAGELPALPSALAGHDHGPTLRPRAATRVTAALDASPELGEILLARWSERPTSDQARSVVLVAHGPTSDQDAARWEAAILSANAPLAAALQHRVLRVGLLRDDAPPPERALAVAAIRDTIAAIAARDADSVLVMTVLVSSGGINRVTVPRDLAGTPMRYAGVVLAPHPALARWIERIAGAK
jgi:sirohydrochlorin ferrochelatase